MWRANVCGSQLHRKTGPVPRLHPGLYADSRQPPAERDMQRYFGVTLPSVHQMVLTLDAPA